MKQQTGVRVLKNAGILAAIEVISKILGLLVIMMAARHLGAVNFGVLAFAFGLTSIFGIFIRFGFDTLIVREIARNESQAARMLGTTIILQSIFSLASFLVIVVIVLGLNATVIKQQVVYLVALGIIADSFTFSFNAFFRAYQSMEYEALARLSYSVLRTVLLVSVLLLGYGLLAYTICEFLGYALKLVVSFWLLRWRITRPVFVFEPRAWLNLLQTALPFVIMAGMITIYVSADTIILSLLEGDEVTGWYSAATQFFFLFAFLPSSITAAVLPVMSKQSVQGGATSKLMKSFNRTFRLLFITALPLALGTAILAEPVIHLLYGAQFTEAVPALQILMIALVFSFVNWASDSTLISYNRERSLLLIVTIGAVFNVVSNLVVIPYLYHVGAAITTVLSEGLVLLLKLSLLRRTFGPLPLTWGLVKPVLSVLAMAGFLLLFSHLPIIFLILPAALIYLGMLAVLRTFDTDELAIIQGVLPLRLRHLLINRGLADGAIVE